MGSIIAFAAALFLSLIGFLGVFLPFLPGVPLAWLGLALYAFVTDFTAISLPTVIIFLGFTILAVLLDVVAPSIGAARYQVSRRGTFSALLGTVIGVVTLGPLGAVVGPMIGAFLGELSLGKRRDEAARSAFGALIGFLAGSLIKLLLILAMIGFLIASLF